MLTWLVALSLAQTLPLAPRHRHWLDEDVVFLASQREKAAFLAAESDEARDRFVERFWNVRDPTPGTARNEVREQHDAWLVEADRRFTLVGSRPGRLTDRGMVYQLLGPPESRQDFSYAAGRVFPLELWLYASRREPFLPESFYLIFFRESGRGDYRLWSPVSDGVQALVPTAEPGRFLLDEDAAYETLGRIDVELAEAARRLVPGDASSFSGMSLEVNLRSYADMAERFHGVETRVRAGAGFRELGLVSTAAVLYDTTGIPQVHYALEVPFSRVGWQEVNDHFRGSFGIQCRVTDERGREVDATEDWLDLDLREQERGSLAGQVLSFQGRLILPAGHYALDFTLVSTPGGTRDRAALSVEVPRLLEEATGSTTVTPILLARGRQPWAEGRFVDRLPFQAGAFVLSPAPDSRFPATEALAYLQIAGASEEAVLDWSLVGENGEVVWSETATLSPTDPPTAALGDTRPVSLAELPDGDYTLRVTAAGQTRTASLFVDRSLELPIVRVLSRESAAAGDGRIRLRRGLLLARIGDRDRAIRELEAAAHLRPRDLEIHLRLALFLYAAERYGEVIEWLEPIKQHYPKESDVFVLLGFSSLQLHEVGRAVSYLEAALALRPDDSRLALALERARAQSGPREP